MKGSYVLYGYYRTYLTIEISLWVTSAKAIEVSDLIIGVSLLRVVWWCVPCGPCMHHVLLCDRTIWCKNYVTIYAMKRNELCWLLTVYVMWSYEWYVSNIFSFFPSLREGDETALSLALKGRRNRSLSLSNRDETSLSQRETKPLNLTKGDKTALDQREKILSLSLKGRRNNSRSKEDETVFSPSLKGRQNCSLSLSFSKGDETSLYLSLSLRGRRNRCLSISKGDETALDQKKKKPLSLSLKGRQNCSLSLSKRDETSLYLSLRGRRNRCLSILKGDETALSLAQNETKPLSLRDRWNHSLSQMETKLLSLS